jgi:hypothetical protein
MRIVAFHDVHTGLALRPSLGAMYGSDAVSEQQLAQEAMERLPADALVLADANFGIFAFAHAVLQTQRAVLFRLTAGRAQKVLGAARPEGAAKTAAHGASDLEPAESGASGSGGCRIDSTAVRSRAQARNGVGAGRGVCTAKLRARTGRAGGLVRSMGRDRWGGVVSGVNHSSRSTTNYFSLSTTTTSLADQSSSPTLVQTGAEDRALQGCNLSADSGARPGQGGLGPPLPVDRQAPGVAARR